MSKTNKLIIAGITLVIIIASITIAIIALSSLKPQQYKRLDLKNPLSDSEQEYQAKNKEIDNPVIKFNYDGDNQNNIPSPPPSDN